MLKVTQISESEFSVKGHGVHTAFVETSNALRRRDDVELQINSKAPTDIVHIHTVGTYALGRLLWGKGKKIVSAHIVPDSLVGSLRGARWWHGIATWYLKWFYNHADVVLAVSDETKQVLEQIGVIRPIEVIYNMVDASRYARSPDSRAQARAKLGFSTDDWIVASNGQVQPRKRVDIFVKLARAMPETKFVWVGGIPFKAAAAQYEKMKKTMNSAPSNVVFTGVVSLDDVALYLQAADVFVMPSDQETFGLAIVEAAAASLPVVLRDLPDYDHTFRSDAIVCQVDEFETALRRLQTDQEYYDQAVRSAESLARRYDSSLLCDKLVGVYRSLLR